MNIIECTLKIKEEMRTHYENLSGAVTDVTMKRLFTLLAAAEQEHIDRILQIRDEAVSAGSDIGDRLAAGVCVFSPGIDPRRAAESLSDDPDAYLHVTHDEEDAIGFFDRLKEQAGNEEMGRICGALAEREREHLSRLEHIYSFVEEPRTYLAWGEFSNLRAL